MSLLFRIVYAAHASGTHHKLALDGLRSLDGAQAEDWRRLFLKHAERLMAGSKAPDDTFKDFKNHVLHVDDDYWGGAPELAVAWYGKTVAALAAGNWEDAVYSAGVLSHYYTDPIHPFHTGQTEAENAIHRAVEWSISRSYDDLRRLGEERFGDIEVPSRDGPDWLKAMVCDGAEFSHRYYGRLIAHYDLTRGVSDPPSGLDRVARSTVAELLIYAATGFGRILQRAIDEAQVAPPQVSLTLDTVMAAVRIPAKTLAKRLRNAEDRAIVEAMYDELTKLGRVDATLPEDDRTVRDLHAREVLAPKQAKRAAARAQRLATVDKPALSSLPPAARRMTAPEAEATAATPAPLPVAATRPAPPPRSQPPVASHALAALKPSPQSAQPPAPGHAAARSYLAAGDPLEAAPSIGPRMAERLAELGLVTVGDFLAADPAKTAARLRDHRISDMVIDVWQCQARLVIEIAGLRGTHAQLLTGAGYRTTGAVAAADPGKLSADLLRFAASSEGRRLLRDGGPPDIQKVKAWTVMARMVQAA